MDVLDGRDIAELDDRELGMRVTGVLALTGHSLAPPTSTRPITGLPCCRCGTLDANPVGYCPACALELEHTNMTPKYVSPTTVKGKAQGRGQVLPLPPDLAKLLPPGVEYRVELSDEGVTFRPADVTAQDNVPLPDWLRAERAKGNGAHLPPRPVAAGGRA